MSKSKDTKTEKERLKPISLDPLELEEVLKALMDTPPPDDDPKRVKDKKKKKPKEDKPKQQPKSQK